MTFYEAAVEVLREAGRPLHFKKITEISLKRNLLSHVGKSPETTMAARLQQELRKGAVDSLIESVRPGVFSLRKDVDPEQAKQTIRLREISLGDEPDEFETRGEPDVGEPAEPAATIAAAPAPETAETADAADDEDDEDADDDNGSASATERSGRKRRRRRRRRGGAAEGEARADQAADDNNGDDDRETAAPAREAAPARDAAAPARQAAPAREAAAATPAPTRPVAAPPSQPAAAAPAPAADRETRRAPPAQRAAATTPNFSDSVPSGDLTLPGSEGTDAGELARVILQLFHRNRPRSAMTLQAIATGLSSIGFGAVTHVGPSIVRNAIEHANRRRSAHGRPPLFVEIRPDHFVVATASDAGLARSYATLDRWQDEHRRVLEQTLIQRLDALDGAALASLLSLLLERLGYEDVRAHERLGREFVTLSASTPAGLTSARVAVRIADPTRPLGREDIMAFRGSLHLYSANEGTIVCLGGVDRGAEREAEVPNLARISLIDARRLAAHIVQAGIGVSAFTVEVCYIDEAFFLDLQQK